MPSRSFAELTISLSGKFKGYKHHKLEGIIEGLGATYSHKVTPNCTHLISTELEMQRRSLKVTQASNAYTCDVVSLQWLLDSERNAAPQPEESYTIPAKSATPAVDNGIVGQKRAIEQVLDMSEDPCVKKCKTELKVNHQDVTIPAHQACPFRGDYSVYIDDTGAVWDAMLVKTAAGGKINHYYHQQLLVDRSRTHYRSWACWGRVGEAAQTLECIDQGRRDAQENFEKRFYQRTGFHWGMRLFRSTQPGKYTYISPGYMDLELENQGESQQQVRYKMRLAECTLPKSVQKVLGCIFNMDNLVSATTAMSYDTRKLPLGKLSKQTLREGYSILKELSGVIETPFLAGTLHKKELDEVIKELSSQYLSIIPHVFGKNQPPILHSEKHIKKELDLLLDLANMLVTTDIVDSVQNGIEHPLDRQFQALGLQEMTTLKHSSAEFKEISRYFFQSPRVTGAHNQIIDIFRIQRRGEEDRLKTCETGNLNNSNRRLLWHGSRIANFAGILSQGLLVSPPGVGANGASFGKGLYFTDASNRSLKFSPVDKKSRRRLLMLCNVELGHPMHEINPGTQFTGRKNGTISTLALGIRGPRLWKDASCIHPTLRGSKIPDPNDYFLPPSASSALSGRYLNEYVVYDPAQVQLKYLVFLLQS
ncbi:hypothetical protein P175DRAFT_0450363 [Aspergillus ochraceoroseus IBT 24754]|uniref:Poly [ADP-ribose] polymerase n=1 Tax=Aspergillus ochraceoroseus IBT 24754 TaxID=1392256 RepID=A0A2T5M7X6_9EURO|nr:uncharacterized protein P175DRAFT_0450363 [Aspergillus ochraceoroseus IBT 24754]PTU24623.1 hypothetical protein P175DRAFT_0450363 [Aspergillus ochraceoroseus IBT 24754]